MSRNSAAKMYPSSRYTPEDISRRKSDPDWRLVTAYSAPAKRTRRAVSTCAFMAGSVRAISMPVAGSEAMMSAYSSSLT